MHEMREALHLRKLHDSSNLMNEQIVQHQGVNNLRHIFQVYMTDYVAYIWQL